MDYHIYMGKKHTGRSRNQGKSSDLRDFLSSEGVAGFLLKILLIVLLSVLAIITAIASIYLIFKIWADTRYANWIKSLLSACVIAGTAMFLYAGYRLVDYYLLEPLMTWWQNFF